MANYDLPACFTIILRTAHKNVILKAEVVNCALPC